VCVLIRFTRTDATGRAPGTGCCVYTRWADAWAVSAIARSNPDDVVSAIRQSEVRPPIIGWAPTLESFAGRCRSFRMRLRGRGRAPQSPTNGSPTLRVYRRRTGRTCCGRSRVTGRTRSPSTRLSRAGVAAYIVDPKVETTQWVVTSCGAGCARVAIPDAPSSQAANADDPRVGNSRWEMT
jgi:hypothetical protein